MIDWWWEIDFVLPSGNVLWDSRPHNKSWVNVNPDRYSKDIGRNLIKITEERDPISCQLYKLVYGRLP